MLPKEKTIQTKAQLKDWLDYELRRYNRKGLRSLFLVSEPSVLHRLQLLLRKSEYYLNTGKRLRFLFYRIRLTRLQCRYGMHIPLNVCGRGLGLMHVGPILINGSAQVGENCSFHINTALVAGGTNSQAPVLEDGVIVGIGAVVLGGVRIAKNVAIGANAVVNKDIPEENIAVAGVPAKKISNNGRLAWAKGKRSGQNV